MADRHWPSGRRYTIPAAASAVFHACFLLLLVMLLALVSARAAAEDIAVQTEKLKKLREQIHDIKTDVDSMRGQRTDVQAALEKTEKEIGSITAELHRLDADSRATRLKIQSLDNDRTTERQMLAGLRETLVHGFAIGLFSREAAADQVITEPAGSCTGRPDNDLSWLFHSRTR